MDRHDILAAVRRAGHTLRTVATTAGLSPGACSKALSAPFPAAERALAECIGKPLHLLFPDRYRRGPGGASIRLVERLEPSTAQARRNSPNRKAA
ncbi:helix-turn-helix domain-containing protein [Labrys sp. 22185]|uniref:helix-turn-helix domain-containing protein n=1 Tax=Labrys sp. 22185 TaxID=3453888 RepID=UPI003F83340A